MKQLVAMSLFSGIGGLCEGVKLGGFRITGAAELDVYAAHNYRLNFPETPLYEGDISDLMVSPRSRKGRKQLEEYSDDGQVDLVFGGPPCQGYSQIGPRDPADPRNELYLQLIRIAQVTRAKFILIENVPNLLLMKNGMFKERITRALIESGYPNIGIHTLAATDYGVPQLRKRVFFLAAKKEATRLSMQNVLALAASALQRDVMTVNDAISDLPATVAPEPGIPLAYPKCKNPSEWQREMRLDLSGEILSRHNKLEHYHRTGRHHIALHNHHTKDIQERRFALIKLLKPGDKANDLPKSVWDRARPEKWRRFDGSRPAHTLMAQMHRDLSEWVHPSFDRWITVREALRLQGFHDGFVLETSEWQQLKQVGNAVPPFLGRVPALAIQFALASDDGRKLPFEVKGQLGLFA